MMESKNVRDIIESFDSLVDFKEGKEHCILPEHYDELAKKLSTPPNEIEEDKCTVFHSPDFSGKCLICKEQVFVRCPECKGRELKELMEKSTYQCAGCDKVFSV